jgi:hypothetical protein
MESTFQDFCELYSHDLHLIYTDFWFLESCINCLDTVLKRSALFHHWVFNLKNLGTHTQPYADCSQNFLNLFFSPLSLFWETKMKLIRSPCCLCSCISPTPYSMWSMWYQMKVSTKLFPEFFLYMAAICVSPKVCFDIDSSACILW